MALHVYIYMYIIDNHSIQITDFSSVAYGFVLTDHDCLHNWVS